MAEALHYTVLESPRAKHVRLRISMRDGSLTIVVPRRFNRREIPDVVAGKRPWIDRVRRRVAEQRRAAGADDGDGLPALIRLPAIGEEWRVDYRNGDRSTEPPPDWTLVVHGTTDDDAACKRAITNWLQRKARAALLPWLDDLASRHNLRVARVAVRSQRTRWGSCSERNGINLNQKLLFLPPPMVEQVMLHELCHTVHHNHSHDFWRLLRSLSADCDKLETQLRSAWRYVPAWIDG